MTIYQTIASAFEDYAQRRLIPRYNFVDYDHTCAVDRSVWAKLTTRAIQTLTDVRETELVYQPEVQALLLEGWLGQLHWISLEYLVKPRPFGDWLPVLVFNHPSGQFGSKVIYLYPEDWKTKNIPISPEDL